MKKKSLGIDSTINVTSIQFNAGVSSGGASTSSGQGGPVNPGQGNLGTFTYNLPNISFTISPNNILEDDELSIEYKIKSEKEKKEIIKKLNKIIGNEVLRFDLRRIDIRDNSLDATYQVNVSEVEMLEKIINKLQSTYPNISVTYLDQNQVPSI